MTENTIKRNELLKVVNNALRGGYNPYFVCNGTEMLIIPNAPAKESSGYKWKGMRKLSWEEVKDILRKKGNLAGYYYLYEDNTEGQISASDSIVDIMDFHDKGGKFGEELSLKSYELPDGAKFTAPTTIDFSELGCMDEFEYQMWDLLTDFFEYIGIELEDKDEPDWDTVKTVWSTIFDILEKTGLKLTI